MRSRLFAELTGLYRTPEAKNGVVYSPTPCRRTHRAYAPQRARDLTGKESTMPQHYHIDVCVVF
jgi:hypothetical protein